MIYQGTFDGSQIRVGLVVSRFNGFITSQLLNGALEALSLYGVKEENIAIVKVPGAFEIALICKKLVKTNKYDVIIALGCVIKGETSHYDYVCNEVSKGVASVSLAEGVPILFGVLTTDNIEQAIARVGVKTENKGYEVAINAVEMANLIKII